MKILILRQCPKCKGSRLRDKIPEEEKCAICKGGKVVEEWIDARDFIRTSINENIKPV